MCRGLEVDLRASIQYDWKKWGGACFGGWEGGEGLSCVSLRSSQHDQIPLSEAWFWNCQRGMG